MAYRDDLRSFEREAPRTGWFAFKILLVVILVGFGLSTVGYVAGWFGEAAKVTQQELGPKALNQKYEWFKDMASSIRAQKANVDTWRNRNDSFKESLGPVANWTRTDRETIAQQSTELAGTIAMYNRSVGEYNAEMSKWHTEFANFGKMPAGWEALTPTEFPPYLTQ